MSQLASHMHDMMSDDIVFVEVVFSIEEPNSKLVPRTYTYKTVASDNIKEGDLVVVEVYNRDEDGFPDKPSTFRKEMKIARVFALRSVDDIDFSNAKFEFRWVVSRVATDVYEERKLRERRFILGYNKLKTQNFREQMKQILITEYGAQKLSDLTSDLKG